MVAGVSTGALIVFAIILVALTLFVTERIPTDVTAIGVLVSLAVLEPWTGVDGAAAIAGFANPATITIVAMYMLSAGVQNTGLVRRLGVSLVGFTRGSEKRALAATVGTTGPLAGFVNNTPVVAVFIPMIVELADQARISPSKLLLPLSYAAMLGGTLTLVGTSTNVLASDLARRQLDRGPIGMFEFTPLGAVILLVGIAYLLTIGRRLTPERLPAAAELTEEFGLDNQLSRAVVRESSPLVGRTVDAADRQDADVRVLQLVSESGPLAADSPEPPKQPEPPKPSEPPAQPEPVGDADGPHAVTEQVDAEPTVLGPTTDRVIRPGDVVTLHGTLQETNRFVSANDLRQLSRDQVTDATFEGETVPHTLAKVLVPQDASLVGRSLADAKLRERHETTVLAVRRGGDLLRTDLDELVVEAGDTLLVQTTDDALEYFAETGSLFLVEDADADAGMPSPPSLSPRTPVAIGIMAAVIGVVAAGWLPVAIAALGGVFAMIVTGCLTPGEAYDAVSWNVVFLLAGVIPLGAAMQSTGGAELLAGALVAAGDAMPHLALLALVYLLTGALANVITPVATVVLMIPIAIDTATRVGAEPFSFLLGVMFAGATAFMTPVGYQTNLMVYGPGGYRFTDFLRVGGPLQLLLAVVTTVGIGLLWGV